jgi:hypothetical protein
MPGSPYLPLRLVVPRFVFVSTGVAFAHPVGCAGGCQMLVRSGMMLPLRSRAGEVVVVFMSSVIAHGLS